MRVKNSKASLGEPGQQSVTGKLRDVQSDVGELRFLVSRSWPRSRSGVMFNGTTRAVVWRAKFTHFMRDASLSDQRTSRGAKGMLASWLNQNNHELRSKDPEIHGSAYNQRSS